MSSKDTEVCEVREQRDGFLHIGEGLGRFGKEETLDSQIGINPSRYT